jgi:hypothetical protein
MIGRELIGDRVAQAMRVQDEARRRAVERSVPARHVEEQSVLLPVDEDGQSR